MKKIRVVGRAGHGGHDRSNVGPTGYVEADGNLKFALYLEEFFSTDPRFEYMNIRKEDIYISLSEGPIRAAEWNADVYISIHSDAYTSRSRGVTIFESVDLDNEDLAGMIGNAIAKTMDISFRGVKSKESKKYPGEDYYTDIDKAQDLGVPYVFLIERGFHSNPIEEAKLKNDEIVKASAKATFEQLQNYFFPEDEHWANKHYVSLNEKGITIHDKRFDDIITRGEVMSMIDRITK